MENKEELLLQLKLLEKEKSDLYFEFRYEYIGDDDLPDHAEKEMDRIEKEIKDIQNKLRGII